MALPLVIILAKVGPRGTAAISCASSGLRAAGSSEALWRRFCADDLGLEAPIGPDDRPLPSFKEAYKAWFQSFGMYPLPLVKRVKSFWSSFKSWLSDNFPEGLKTLGDGVSEAQIISAEFDLGFDLPMPTKVLYRFCNGQLHYGRDVVSHGVIGGYEFDYEKVIVCLLPLNRIVEGTWLLRCAHGACDNSNYIVVAVDASGDKAFLLDCLNGQLYVGTEYLKEDGEVMSCVPKSLIRLTMDDNNDMPQDGLLLWLEEHLRRLQSGLIKVEGYSSQKIARHISIYPAALPYCSSAVAHGVKVRVSAIFAAESSAHGDYVRRYVYYYSIRLSLPEAYNVDGKWYSSFQFQSHHWTIRIGDNVISDAYGYGVHGKYPVLMQGEELSVYGSFTSPAMVPGSIEGYLTLTPLRCRQPRGNQLVVNIDPFPLQPPEYIF